MKISNFDTDQNVFIIAEIGNCHEGSVSVAEELIAAAAQAGVDAVKFQTIVPSKLVSLQQVDRIKQLSRFQLSYEQFTGLSEVARNAGVLFMSSPFDLESVDALEPIVDAYKVSSGDNTFYPMLDRICATRLPLIISAGLTDWALIEQIRDHVVKRLGGQDAAQQLAILHCACSYPVPDEQANLAVIAKLAELGVTVGYSDHTLGIDAAALAPAFGARIIEKHFTLDKNYSDFRDHQLSADPDEMKALVKRIRKFEIMRGVPDKVVLPCEQAAVVAVRRSVAAARDLASGTVLADADLTWVRPGGGCAPGEESRLVGKTLNSSLASGQMILPEHLSE